MRLRVTVRRHGLPETPIIWVIDTNSAPTVFHLLEQINEIIPIESDGEWGLEDYAVELKGVSGVNYECLHFQPVANVMKEDDEVLIRPLMTQDIKIRRVSGRRQISSYGAHLHDGVVFGRPLLRLSDRPSIHIPPRKKRRITTDVEENGQDEQDSSKPEQIEDTKDEIGQELVLHADFNEEDSEEDDDFAPSDEEDDEDAELGSQESDKEMTEDDRESEFEEEEQVESPASEMIEPCLSEIEDPVTRTKIRKLHVAFPSTELGVCKYVMEGVGFDLGNAYDALLIGFPAVQPKSVVTEILQGKSDLAVPKTRTKAFALANAALEKPEIIDSMQVERDDSPNPMIDFYDQNGLPPGSINSGKALSFMADAVKGISTRFRSESRKSSIVSNSSPKAASSENIPIALGSTPAIDKQPEGESSEEESDESSEDSSSEDESSEVSSDSSDEEMADHQQHISSSSDSDSDSDSSSESSSDGDDEPEIESTKYRTVQPPKYTASITPIGEPKSKRVQHVAPPGMGTSNTQSRNERRRRAAALKKYKDNGILPSETTIEEFRLLDQDQLGSSESAAIALETLRASQSAVKASSIANTTKHLMSDAQKFEHRRKELLASLADGGIDIGKEASPKAKTTKSQTSTTKSPMTTIVDIKVVASSSTPRSASNPEEIILNAETMDIDEGVDASTPAKPRSNKLAPASIPPSSIESNPASAGPRRAKLDLGAGRRMLFGALGIKNPKTKKDEDKIRDDLMKGVKPLITPKSAEEVDFVPEEVAEDSDAWKDSITYRAVECVQEGIELSEPPFPFKQRWDPQQQYGGKRKKDQRDQAQYYDENRPSKKQKRRKGKQGYQEGQKYFEDPTELNYDDNYDAQDDETTQMSRPEINETEGEISQQLMNDVQEPAESVSQIPDDLAPLPDNPSTLPDLAKGAAKVGMTIAFKCLEMSEATKWQPKISSYRTAIVISLTDNGEFHLSLAMRDRKAGKMYDEETGERIYGKFDMPDDDDEMDEGDDGTVIYDYHDFVEPKVVQEPPRGLSLDSLKDEIPPSDGRPKGDTSATMSNEGEPTKTRLSQAEARFSHVIETPLNSDALEQPDSMQVDRVGESAPSQEQADIIVNADLRQEVTHDTPIVSRVSEMTAPRTPGLRGNPSPAVDVLTPSAQISDENRQRISLLMRDAGFRSSVSSSIMRGIQLETPGDDLAMERLRDAMTDTPRDEETSYSPRFNGFESSPPSNEAKNQKDIDEFISVVESQPSSSREAPQSSWKPVDRKEGSTTPTPPQAAQVESPRSALGEATGNLEDSSSSSEDSGSSTPEPVKPREKLVIEDAPTSKAQLLWEQLKSKAATVNADTISETEEISQASLGVDASITDFSNHSVHYPKVSGGSSFTSQITDHGRQPDFTFEDDEALNADTLKAATSGSQLKQSSHELTLDAISEQLLSKARAKNTEDTSSGSESQLLRKLIGGIQKGRNQSSRVSEEDDFSDALPSLALLSQRSQSRKSVEPKSNKGITMKAAAAMSEDSMSSDDEDIPAKPLIKQQIFPQERKVSAPQQRMNAPAASQPSRSYQPLASQPSVSQPRPTQSQPIISRGVIDLTQSSDIEVEEGKNEAEEERGPMYKSEPKPLRRKRADLSSSDDDNEEVDTGASGWVSKKKHGLSNGGRRQTSIGIRESAQYLPNVRRKTSNR